MIFEENNDSFPKGCEDCLTTMILSIDNTRSKATVVKCRDSIAALQFDDGHASELNPPLCELIPSQFILVA